MPIVGWKETPRLTSRLAHACHQRNCLKQLRSVRSVWRTVALRQKRRRSTGEQPWPYIALWLASTVLHLSLDLKYSQNPRCQGAAVYMSSSSSTRRRQESEFITCLIDEPGGPKIYFGRAGADDESTFWDSMVNWEGVSEDQKPGRSQIKSV